jgi:hypothetical protein
VKLTMVNQSVAGNATDISGVLGDCTFSVENVSGRCRAEFQGVHVENLQPQSRSSTANGWKLDKFAFHFQTTVHVCGCDIPLQVNAQFYCII